MSSQTYDELRKLEQLHAPSAPAKTSESDPPESSRRYNDLKQSHQVVADAKVREAARHDAGRVFDEARAAAVDPFQKEREADPSPMRVQADRSHPVVYPTGHTRSAEESLRPWGDMQLTPGGTGFSRTAAPRAFDRASDDHNQKQASQRSASPFDPSHTEPNPNAARENSRSAAPGVFRAAEHAPRTMSPFERSASEQRQQQSTARTERETPFSGEMTGAKQAAKSREAARENTDARQRNPFDRESSDQAQRLVDAIAARNRDPGGRSR